VISEWLHQQNKRGHHKRAKKRQLPVFLNIYFRLRAEQSKRQLKNKKPSGGGAIEATKAKSAE
jgi:hypothetical protein